MKKNPSTALYHDPEAPFAAPWQAEAFACAVALSRKGLYAWTEWVEVFSAEIAAHPARPDESGGDTYYRQWLAALETLVRRKGAASAAELVERRERWRLAYLRTPHGELVLLARAAAPAPAPAAAAPATAAGAMTASAADAVPATAARADSAHGPRPRHDRGGCDAPVAVSPASR